MLVVTIFRPTEEITLRRVIEIYYRLYIFHLIYCPIRECMDITSCIDLNIFCPEFSGGLIS